MINYTCQAMCTISLIGMQYRSWLQPGAVFYFNYFDVHISQVYQYHTFGRNRRFLYALFHGDKKSNAVLLTILS